MSETANNLFWHHHKVCKAERAVRLAQTPCVLWFTGLSGSGKSTLAGELERRLFDMGRACYLLDGDNVRHGLNGDLGFSDADRSENVRRVAHVSRLMADAGLIAIAAFISPFEHDRQMARELVGVGNFFEIYLDVSFEVCLQRDPKGLYAKACSGQVDQFTGLDSSYEPPRNPELSLNTSLLGVGECVDRIVEMLVARGMLVEPSAECLQYAGMDVSSIVDIAEQAGAAILAASEEKGVSEKLDGSPLTRADNAANAVIISGLERLAPSIPIVSEESALPERSGECFWLVDPLDGTKEFISGSGEYTVNIALIEQGVPVLGVVYAPALDQVFVGVRGVGAWKRTQEQWKSLAISRWQAGHPLRIVGSRSHAGPDMVDFLAACPVKEYLAVGSSLKFCLVAEGKADLYPRLGPTSLWDTAAAQCVLEAAGGSVLTLSGEPLDYCVERNILNPYFVAMGSRQVMDLLSPQNAGEKFDR